MVAPIQLAVSSREPFLAAAQREFAAFERKESEFQRKTPRGAGRRAASASQLKRGS